MREDILILTKQERSELWHQVIEAIETYLEKVTTHRVTPDLSLSDIQALLKPINFNQPVNPQAAVNFVLDGLWKYQVHTSHPGYFGLFNPAPTTMGIAADTLVAAFNPQLAAWSHGAFAVEVEQHLLRSFGSQFGYEPAHTDGTFTSGGSEANQTAVITALTNAFPEFARWGVRGLESQPVLYVSSESHHSFLKAALLSGLGIDAVRKISVGVDLQMDTESLCSQINKDRHEGFAPFMVVATAGTTSAGVVDPIQSIADIAAHERIWFHIDAAWGGAAVLVPELRRIFKGAERADSITFDAHKWLSVPMGAGLYLTRHLDILERAFRLETSFMPRDAKNLDVVEPYVHSIQWSRRFIGLKLFLSLMVAGWDGYAVTIRHQVAMGEQLRQELEATGWEVINKTILPVVCFVDREHPEGRSAQYLNAVAHKILSSGKAWISTTGVSNGMGGTISALRACITNYQTERKDILDLVQMLNWARQLVRKIA